MNRHQALFFNETIRSSMDAMLIDVLDNETASQMLYNDDRETWQVVYDLYLKGDTKTARQVVINFYTAVLRMGSGML